MLCFFFSLRSPLASLCFPYNSHLYFKLSPFYLGSNFFKYFLKSFSLCLALCYQPSLQCALLLLCCLTFKKIILAAEHLKYCSSYSLFKDQSGLQHLSKCDTCNLPLYWNCFALQNSRFHLTTQHSYSLFSSKLFPDTEMWILSLWHVEYTDSFSIPNTWGGNEEKVWKGSEEGQLKSTTGRFQRT